MLQRQIVVKALGKQIDIDDPAYTKYASTSFQSIVWMLTFDIVTIKRNASLSLLSSIFICYQCTVFEFRALILIVSFILNMDGYFDIEVYLIFEYSKITMHIPLLSLLFPFLFYFCRCCLGAILMCYMNAYIYIYIYISSKMLQKASLLLVETF
jgi:hypothetical protein